MGRITADSALQRQQEAPAPDGACAPSGGPVRVRSDPHQEARPDTLAREPSRAPSAGLRNPRSTDALQAISRKARSDGCSAPFSAQHQHALRQLGLPENSSPYDLLGVHPGASMENMLAGHERFRRQNDRPLGGGDPDDVHLAAARALDEAMKKFLSLL